VKFRILPWYILVTRKLSTEYPEWLTIYEPGPQNMIGQQSSSKIPIGADRSGRRRGVAAVCLVLAAITFAVFGQALTHEFINYDDDTYVYDNPIVVQGLTLKGIVWAFSGSHASNWHPLTWLSHMVDCQLYGLNPAGHHLTNILLHAATVIALFLVLRQMTGAFWRSAFVAAVFAIHPLRAESVAWVSERKDVLSGLFFMLTVGAYVRYARLPWSAPRYGLVAFLFAIGLLCKPMLVTLPLVLLLLDYWPLRRVESQKFSGLVMEKLPFLALSAVSCVATLFAQKGALQSTEFYPLPLRLGNAEVACVVYLGQMVYPAGLAVFYPFPLNGLPLWEVVLAGVLLAGFSAFALGRRRTQPWLLVGWCWYLVMLLPVMGIVQVGRQAHADRYTYLPQIGIYMAMTWTAAEWSAKRQVKRVAVGSLMTGVLAVLMVCAWQQTGYWQDSETLWFRTLACTTHNEVAHYNLGNVLWREDRVDEAISQYQKALEISPDYLNAHLNLGICFFRAGRMEEAISQYQKALQIAPSDSAAQNDLAWLLATCSQASLRNGAKAMELARQANGLTGGKNPIILHTLAAACAEAGRFPEAVETAQRALPLAEAQSDANLAGQLELELKLYQAGAPFHSPAPAH
jgi:Tfp pilus assembly protein PilF